MLMVLNLHSFWGFDYGSGFLQAIDIFRESTSICAVDAFILISGYFGIKWKWKSFFNLTFQCFFYSFVVYGTAVILGVIEFNNAELGECFKALYKSWPFISSYIFLYFMAPLLNIFSEKSSSQELLLFILILFLAENFIMHATGTSGINFCLVYLVGRFMREKEIPQQLNASASKGYWLITVLIFVIVYCLYLIFHFDGDVMTRLVIAYNYSSPFVILQACFLFMFFYRFKFQSKIVNWCASSCLAVFLIHMHPAVAEILYKGYTRSLYSLPVAEHILVMTALIISVFVGCILIDKVRIAISDIVYKMLSLIFRRVPSKYLLIETYIPERFAWIIK